MLGLLCLFLLALYLLIQLITYRRQVNQFPGPPVKSVLLGNLDHFIKPSSMSKNCYLKKFFNHFGQTYAKYRDAGVFRMWIGPINAVYILTSPATIENLLSSHANVNKGAEYRFLSPWLGSGLLTSQAETWRSRRKLLVTGFHVKILQDFLPIFEKHTQILLGRIREEADGVVGDIRPLFEDCTLDIVKETSLGLDPHSDASHLNHTYRTALKNAFFGAVDRMHNPLHWLDLTYSLTEKGRRFAESVAFLSNYADVVIEKRRRKLFGSQKSDDDPNNNSKDSGIDDEDTSSLDGRIILDILLKHSATAATPLSSTVIKSEVNTFILGGHDTTAMALTFTTLLLGHHPEVQQKVVEELETIFGDGLSKDDEHHRPITLGDLRQMRYLEQCIKESLRLYPSVQVVGRHLSEPLPLPGGSTLPAGSTAYIVPLFLHRDPKLFPDPDAFKPERFSPEVKQVSPYAFIPFSAGPRNCIGQRYALLELKYVLASLFRQYQIRSHTRPEVILKGIAPVLKPLNAIEVHFEARRRPS